MINRRGFLLSVFFHMIIIFVGVGTFKQRRPITTPQIMPVQFLPIRDKTVVKKIQSTQKKKKLKSKDYKAAKETLKDIPEQLEEPMPPKTKHKDVVAPPSKKRKKKMTPPKETPKEVAAKKEVDPFMSVLKTIEDLAPEVDEEKTPDKKKKLTAADNIADYLSVSELDALKKQVAKCWTMPAGAKGIEEMVIEIEVLMNPDATVQKAEVRNNDTRNPFFRSAAESAKRALYHSDCTPLKLPKNKYEEWRAFKIIFDPKEMFG